MKNSTTQVNFVKNVNSKKYYDVFILTLLLSLMVFTIQVKADVIGVDPNPQNSSSAQIQTFNQATWASVSGPFPLTMTGFTVLGGQSVTWNSDNLLFYSIITVDPDPVGGTIFRYLVTVVPGTGVCTPIGDMGGGFSSLTYNSDLGILYAMGGSGGITIAARLFTVNITTGATTFLGGPYPLGNFGQVIAYNYDDHLIYHWSGGLPANMETIDPAFPLIAVPIIQTGVVHTEIQGAVYLGGGVFAATDLNFGVSTNAYTITSAGVVTLVGPTPYQVRGLGFVDPLLPVELASFVSSVNRNNIVLTWTTASETNNSGFDIERSKINGQWARIGNVTGMGTSAVPKNYSFSDRNMSTGSYSYRLKQIDFNGNFEYFNLSSEVTIGIPVNFELSQNYPNPFNPSTTIDFQLPKDGNATISIFDNSGKEVMTLVNEFKSAGYHSINFNASSLSSGVYFYKLWVSSPSGETGSFIETKRMVLIK